MPTKKPKMTTAERALHVQPVVDGDAPPRALLPSHVDDLRSSGLTDDTIALSGIYSETKSEPIARILDRKWSRGGGMVIPFREYTHGREVLARVKPDKPRVVTKNGKPRPIKYDQRADSGIVAYYGPRTILERKLDDAHMPRVWSEGEKKALLLDQLGFAAIGLTGVHNFHDADAFKDGDGLTWAPRLKHLGETYVRGFDHVIAFDADAFENEHVMLAMRRLAGLLVDGGARTVSFVRVPALEAGAKTGIDDFFVARGEEATRALFAAAERFEADLSPIPPKDPLPKFTSLRWFRDAELPGDLRIPPMFSVRSDRSLWFTPAGEEALPKEFMRSVLIPTRLLIGADGNRGDVEVTYFARDAWRRSVVDRKSLRDSRRILAELPHDAAVDSNNAAQVVAWFGEFFRHNEHRLPLVVSVDLCGWHDITAPAFAAGDIHRPESCQGPTVVHAPELSELAAAMGARGDAKAHRDAIARAFAADSLCAVAILAALAAPLLKSLGAPNFALHLYGDSSRGKTSKVKIAASVYGDPSNAQWFGSWDATPTATERRAVDVEVSTSRARSVFACTERARLGERLLRCRRRLCIAEGLRRHLQRARSTAALIFIPGHVSSIPPDSGPDMGRTEEAIAGYGRHWALGRLVFGRFLCDADGFLDPGGSNTHSSQVASDRPREGSREVEAVLPPLPPMPGTVDDTWRNNVTSPWTWRSCANQIGAYGEPVAGEGGGFFVTCAELGDRRGYMKPRRKAVGPFSNRAAREKIVSDLAHDLGTSVPPVMLATRENAPSSEEALVCVSLVMYPLQWPWKVMKELVVDPSRNERASNIVMNDLPIAAAQGWALDTWVSQPDHNDHPQNIFYGYERGDTPAGRFCFLDYAWALGHQMVESAFKWRGGGWRNVGAAPFPPHMLRFMSTDALLSVVERIEQFPEDTIRNVVERIPRVYMDDDEKDVVIEGLLGRRQMVRELTTRGA